MIRYACPGCSAELSAPDERANGEDVCPRCGTRFLIPGLQDDPTPSAPPGTEPVSPVPVSPVPSVSPRQRWGDQPRRESQDPDRNPPQPRERDHDRERDWGREDRDRDERDRDRDRDERDDRDYPSRRRRRPEKVGAIGGMLLGGGIYALVQAVLAILGSGFLCCLWPPVYFALVWGILAIIRGASITNDTDKGPPPRVLMICQILMILNLDIPNTILGILGLVFLGEPEVNDYFNRHSPDYFVDDR